MNLNFKDLDRKLMILFGLWIMLVSCSPNNPKVLIETDLGSITVELYQKRAPVTTANFMRYVLEERYIGATFYRVVTPENQPNSTTKIEVIQGGLYEDNPPLGLPPIPHESTDETGILHKHGVISMARYEPGTATFEFFICVGDQPSLDYGGGRNPDNQGFAAFGCVIEGMEVVRKIQHQPEKDQYLEPRVEIKRMVVIN